MPRSARRSIHVAPAIVACLLLTSCAYITRVSGEFGPTTPAVSTANGDISNDGSIVVFDSTRSFDGGDRNGDYDVIVSDRNSGVIRRVSALPSGEAPAGQSSGARISGNGEYVVWTSAAPDIVAGDTNGMPDVFRTELRTGITERVSVSTAGVQGNNSSSAPSISDDGRYVAFSSLASTLVTGDTNNRTDVFVRDMDTKKTTRWSTTAAGAQVLAGDSRNPDISGDGKVVVFESSAATLVPNAINGRIDIYRKSGDGAIELLSRGPGGVLSNHNSQTSVTNHDGSVVAFQSRATNLDPLDTADNLDVYVWRNGAVELASRGPAGEVGSRISSGPSLDSSGTLLGFTTNSFEITATSFTQGVVRDLDSGRVDVVSSTLLGDYGTLGDRLAALSGNGRFAVVRGFSPLVSGDTNGVEDIFVKSYPQPVITNVVPDTLIRGATTTVTISGEGFAAPSSVLLEDAGGTPLGVGPVTVLSPDRIAVDITVPLDAARQPYSLVVRNDGLFAGDLGASGACAGCITVS